MYLNVIGSLVNEFKFILHPTKVIKHKTAITFLS